MNYQSDNQTVCVVLQMRLKCPGKGLSRISTDFATPGTALNISASKLTFVHRSKDLQLDAVPISG